MSKTIRGKEYELISGECENCIFNMNPGCGIEFGVDDCLETKNDDLIWKEVKNDSASNDV